MSNTNNLRQLKEAVESFDQGGRFKINANDFLSARELGEAPVTRIDQMTASLGQAAEIVNRSFGEEDEESGQYTNVISPLVIPERRYSFGLLAFGVIAIAGLVGSIIALGAGANAWGLMFLGPHFWVLALAYVVYKWWRQSIVMVPDGCQALISRYGKLERTVGAGRTLLLNPWMQVSYIVNTSREYPYNAPIYEAPTSSRVSASVDLFLQFKIEDPTEFIFTLGGVQGFQDKLENAISESTRTLIYDQRAEDIYDLVGESTQELLNSLNDQFMPAVRFNSANITHAEPSSRDYRMDLAAPEMVRVAKEAYTYQYELELRKEQNDGELNKELASLRETLSAIRAEIATYQAQMDTARERETNRAKSYAQMRLSKARSSARANSALLEAQALDIRAVSSAGAPEILEYRFQQEVLDRLESVADHLPQLIQVGDDGQALDFLEIAQQMIGRDEDRLYTPEDMQMIRDRLSAIEQRIKERSPRIEQLVSEETDGSEEAPEPPALTEEVDEEQVERIRRSVTDERIQQRVERISQTGSDQPELPPDNRSEQRAPEDNEGDEEVRA